MKKYFFSLILLIVVLVSCTEKKPQFVGSNTRVLYFIEGRLKTVEVFKSLPFKVIPYYLNSDLFDEKMSFFILDASHFRIRYVKDNNPYTVDGTFGNSLINTDMKLMVTNNINDSSSIFNKGNINWLIQVSNQ